MSGRQEIFLTFVQKNVIVNRRKEMKNRLTVSKTLYRTRQGREYTFTVCSGQQRAAGYPCRWSLKGRERNNTQKICRTGVRSKGKALRLDHIHGWLLKHRQ